MADTTELVLDRVLDCDEVALGRVECVQRRVQRRGLPRSGGARHENGPVRLSVSDSVALLDSGQEAELGEVQGRARLVEHSKNDLFTVHRRERRHPEVDLAPAGGEGDATVLGNTMLGDVEAGHDLEACGHTTLDRLRRPGDLMEHAVDPEPNTEIIGAWLDVDVRSAFLKGLAQDQVDVLDDRGVFDHRVKIGDLGDLGLVAGRRLRRSGLGGEGRFAVVPVDAGQVLGYLACAANNDMNVVPEQSAQVVNCENVRGVRHADHGRVTAVGEGEHSVATGKRLGDQLCRLGVELLVVEIDELHAGLGGRCTDQVLFGDEAELAQDVAERPPRCRPLAQRGFHFLAGDLPGAHEQLGEVRRCLFRGLYVPFVRAAAAGGTVDQFGRSQERVNGFGLRFGRLAHRRVRCGRNLVECLQCRLGFQRRSWKRCRSGACWRDGLLLRRCGGLGRRVGLRRRVELR